MVIKNIRSLFLTLCLAFMLNSMAMAKDNELEKDMIELERVYIATLALTNGESPKTVFAMNDYKTEWDYFSENYQTYRSSYRNWISYFMHIGELIGEAADLVDENELKDAHEVLEEIRTTMAEFRGRNAFPKFITDDFTAFHSIMGEIIGISSTSEPFNDNTIAILEELYNEASHAWFKVEKNRVDLNAWDVNGGMIDKYNEYITNERAALDNFEAVLSTGEKLEVAIAAGMLKPNQAKAYLLLSSFSTYIK